MNQADRFEWPPTGKMRAVRSMCALAAVSGEAERDRQMIGRLCRTR